MKKLIFLSLFFIPFKSFASVTINGQCYNLVWNPWTGTNQYVDCSSSNTFVSYSSAAVSYLGISSTTSSGGTPSSLFVYTSTTDYINVTGDGTTFYMTWAPKVIDVNNEMVNNTTFTAKTAGKYLFVINMNLMGIDACCMREKVLTLYTTKRTFQFFYDKINPHTNMPINLTCITDMDIGDKAYVSIMVNNGGLEVDLPGNPFWTNFSGTLLTGGSSSGGGGGGGTFTVANSSSVLSQSISTINFNSDMNVSIAGGTVSVSANGNIYPTFSTTSVSYLSVSSTPWTITDLSYSSAAVSYLGISSTPWTSTTLSLTSATATYPQFSSASVSYLGISSETAKSGTYVTYSSASLSYLGISSTPWTTTDLSLSSAILTYPQFSSAAVSYLAISTAGSTYLSLSSATTNYPQFSSTTVSYLGISSTPWTTTMLSNSSATTTYVQYSSASASYLAIGSAPASAGLYVTYSSASVSYTAISTDALKISYSSASLSYLGISSAPAAAGTYVTYSSAALSYVGISSLTSANNVLTLSSAALSYVGISSLTAANQVLTLSSAAVSYTGISSAPITAMTYSSAAVSYVGISSLTAANQVLTLSSAAVSYFGISSNTFTNLTVSSMTGNYSFVSTVTHYGVTFSSAIFSMSTATVVLSTTANNYLPGDRPVCYASATQTNVWITGFGNASDGKTFTIFNVSTQPISLISNSSFSATANQINADNSVSVTLSSGSSRTLIYDSRILKWRIFGGNFNDTSSMRLYDATVSTFTNMYMQNASSTTILWGQMPVATTFGADAPTMNLIVTTDVYHVNSKGLPNETGASKTRGYSRLSISTGDIQFLFQNDNLSPNVVDLYGFDPNGSNNFNGRALNLWNTTNSGITQILTNPSQSGTSGYFWPIGNGTSGQVMQTDGVNVLSWVAPSSASVVTVAIDSTTTSVSFTTAPGLGFGLTANANYRFHFVLFSSAAVTTTGTGYTVLGPANTTLFNAGFQINFTTGVFAVAVTTTNSAAVFEHTSAGTVLMPTYIDGMINNGPNAGNLQVQFRSGVATSGVTLRRGSYGEIWRTY